MYVHMYIHLYLYVYIYMYIHMHNYTYIPVYIYMHITMYIYMRTPLCIYKYIHMHIHMYNHIHSGTFSCKVTWTFAKARPFTGETVSALESPLGGTVSTSGSPVPREAVSTLLIPAATLRQSRCRRDR